MDNWTPFGNLQTFLNLNPSSRLNIPKGAAVADLFIEGSWSLPPALFDEHVSLYAFLSTIILSDNEDHYEW